MLHFFKGRHRSTAVFTAAASLFTVGLIILLTQFTESQEESRRDWEEAALIFSDATPNIDIIDESLRPGAIPEYLLFATHDAQENYFYIAADAAKAPLEAVTALQAIFRTDSPAQLILAKLYASLSDLSELPLTDRPLVDVARELLFFDPAKMQRVYADIELLRGLARESVRELEARGIASAKELRLFILLGWVAVLLAILTTGGLVLHLTRLEKIADQGRKDAERRLELEREAREASSFAAKLFEALPVSVVTISSDGIIQTANSATAELLGYSVNELCGKNIKALMPERDAVHHDQYLRNYERTGSAKVIAVGREVKALTSTGHEFEVHLSVTEFSQGGKKLFAGILVDMSELVRQRNEITDALAVVEATNAQMEEALEAAQVAAKSKDMFLASASHEIRTPLTGMLGMITLLGDTQMTQEQADMVGTLEGSSRQLLAIINDILDAAKLRESGVQLQLETAQLGPLTSLVRSTFEPMATSKKLDFAVEISPLLAGQYYVMDSVRVGQVLNNLVSNAIKFTDRGKVALSVELLDQDEMSHQLRFAVSDSGEGIPANLIETLGKPFTQIDNALNRSRGGTGLGLTVSKSLIALMGGDLRIESTVGKGSCFSFAIRLPLGVSTGDISQRSATNTDLLLDIDLHTKPRILIAEDNPVNRMVIDKMLAKLPLDYTIVENGQEAVDELTNHVYHLVLTDIQMPKLDGFEATKQMRQLENGRDIPIIALSAATFDDDRARMVEAGMDDFVAKPIDRPKLINALTRHLKAYKA